MADFQPERARGERSDLGPHAPPRPDEDERWDYIADHLRAIRASLGFLVAVTFFGVLVGIAAFMGTFSESP